jgi:hypothetical protein
MNTTHPRRTARFVRILLMLIPALFVIAAVMLRQYSTAQAAVSSIEVTIIAAPNLIVDSNALSPSTEQPEVATVIGRFCNPTGSAITNVIGYIGDFDVDGDNDGGEDDNTSGNYPTKTNPGIFTGTYSFTHLGADPDSSRIIGTIPAGECRYQYWSFTYPILAVSGGSTVPAWGTSVKPDDDMSLDFNVWAAEGSDQCNLLSDSCAAVHTMTMRNEISAMANKIEPNGNPGGQWFNTIDDTVNTGDTVTTNGILYRLGNVGKGFDNDGDGSPDYNAWLQPIGNTSYDPNCFRLISVSGLLTVTRSGGADMVIPFNHALNMSMDAPLLFFTDLPPDNTDVNGLVYYEFLALGGLCTIPVSPYQEVASGADNEKFNGDYGAGGPGQITVLDPTLDFDKSGPVYATEGGSNLTYTISFEHTGDVGTSDFGLVLSTGESYHFVISDTVPAGLQYVTGSTSTSYSPALANSYTIYYSTNSGTTWSTTEPAGNPTSTAPDSLVMIQWWLNEPVARTESGTVSFQARVPSGYITGGGAPIIENCADARMNDAFPMDSDCTYTLVKGINSIGDLIFSDDGSGSGSISNNGIKETNESVLNGVTVTLYWDKDGDGVLDATDPEMSSSYTVIDGQIDIDGSGTITTADDGEFEGYNVIDGRVDVNGDNSLTSADDGASVIDGYNVIDGYLDIDGDAAAVPDTGDDGSVTGTTTASKAVNVIDGYLDMDGDTTIADSGDDGTYAGYTIIDGQIDVNGDGSITTADDGTGIIGGYNVIDGRVDIVVSGTITTADDGSLTGIYGFAYLPDADYIVVVTTTDTDITTGYGPTTAKSYAVDLDSAGASATAVNNRSSDFGFGPSLTLNKYLISSEPAYVASDPAFTGENVTFRIELVNNLPGDGTANGFCQYMIWSTVVHPTTGQTPPGGGNAHSQWQNTANGLYSPDLAYTTTILDDNTDTIGFSGFNMGDQGGTITDVDLVVYATEVITLPDDDDQLELHVYYNNSDIGGAGFIFVNSTTFTAATGEQVIIIQDVDDTLRTGLWTWSDFQNNLTELQVVGDNGPGTSGDLGVDAVAYRVTTDQQCGGADTTIATLPVTDTFNAAVFNFISADPAESSTTTGLTSPYANTTRLNWANMGPLYAGQTKYITVTLQAHTATAPSATTNYAGVTGALFGNGRSVNNAYDSDDVTINQSGSISGFVWSDTNGSGWTGTTGYNAGDTFIPGVTVQLYVCASITTNVAIDPPAPSTNKDCEDAANDGVWTLVATDTTDTTGAYSFTGLRDGYYNVIIVPSSLPAGYQDTGSRQAEPDPDQSPTGFTCGTCDWQWNTTTANLDTFNAVDNSGGADNISNVSFGYQDNGDNQGALLGYVWEDQDGDGVFDGTEVGLENITVYLCTSTPCNSGTASQTVNTDSNGLYSFGNLTPGSYFVAVDRATDLPGMTQTGDPDQPGVTCTTSCDDLTTTSVTVSANEVEQPYNFGYDGGLTIGDTVYADWNGDGTQDSGEEGIENVTVRLYRDFDGDGVVDIGTDTLIATDTTDASGNYQFTSIPPNQDYIVVIVESSLPAGYVQTGDPDEGANACTTCDAKNPIALGGTSVSDSDFGYQPQGTASIGDYVWNDEDAGGDQDSGETGIGNVTLNLYQDQDGDGVIEAADALVATVVTLDYDVVNGYLDIDGDGVTAGDADDDATSVYGYDIINGLVDINDDGSITAADDGEWFGYSVFNGFIDVDGDNSGTSDSGDDADLHGAYNFTDLPSGEYIVEVAQSEFSGGGDLVGLSLTSTGAAYDNSPPVVTYEVTLTSGEDYDDADFGFGEGKIGDLIWSDNDGDGTPDVNEPGIGGVTVSLYDDTNGNGNLNGGEPLLATVKTSYAIVNGGQDVNGDGSITAADDATNIGGYNVIDGRLDIDNSGTITSADDGTFLGYDVIDGYVDADGDGITAADADDDDADALGIYEFGGLDADDYVIVVTPPSGYTLTGDPDAYGINGELVPPCSTTNVNHVDCDNEYGTDLYAGQKDYSADFGYQPNNSIGDRLWIDINGDGDDESGAESGISDITVYLCTSTPCSSSNDIASTTTDEDGYYSFGNLANGTYYVAVDEADTDFPAGFTQTYDPDEANPCTTCDAQGTSVLAGTPDMTVDFGYDLVGPNTISGTVFFDDDNDGGAYTPGNGDDPISGVSVYLWYCVSGCGGGDDILISSTTTAGDGTYSFGSLPNGSYRIAVDNGSTPLDGLDATREPGQDPCAGLCNGYNDVTISGNSTGNDYGFYGVIDYGDLPSSYDNTVYGDDGARHEITGPYLGSASPDSEGDGQETATAVGDDNNGSDDEGGVTRNNWANGTDGGSINVTVGGCTNPCYLSAWVDWNGDGDFYDANEKVLSDETVSNGSQVVTFDVPAGTFGGVSNLTFNTRFRIYENSTGGFSQPTGLATNGEVEDYQWNFTPTAITLETLSARTAGMHPALLAGIILLISVAALLVIRQARMRASIPVRRHK